MPIDARAQAFSITMSSEPDQAGSANPAENSIEPNSIGDVILIIDFKERFVNGVADH